MRILFLVLFCAALGAQADNVPVPTVDHGPLDTILRQTVRDERIDYVAVRDQHRGALQAYLQALAQVDVAALPEPNRLAYWFNLYNAGMIAAVVERLRADWSPAKDDYAVFKDKAVKIKGKVISLDEIEHEILRKRFKEPRLHVALVCGARSCPPLLRRAYRAEDLNAVLEANMRRFVKDETRNQVDHDAKKLRVSRILDWFKDDFGGDAGVKALLGQYLGKDVSKYELSYLEYDWTLNLATPGTGWLAAVTRDAPLASGAHTDDVVAQVQVGELLHAFAESDGVVEVALPGETDKRVYVRAESVRKL